MRLRPYALPELQRSNQLAAEAASRDALNVVVLVHDSTSSQLFNYVQRLTRASLDAVPPETACPLLPLRSVP